MKLKKLQRHTAYIIMLAECNEDVGFCKLILDLFDIGDGGNEYVMKDHFPELFQKRPADCRSFWFPLSPDGNNKRKLLLQECIKETA